MIFRGFGAEPPVGLTARDIDYTVGDRFDFDVSPTQSQVVNISGDQYGGGATPTWIWVALALVGSVTLLGGAYVLRR